MYVQYIGGSVQYIGGGGVFSTSGGGCSVHRGDTMSTSGGYHEYIGGCSVHRRDTMSTSGDVQYIGGPTGIAITRICCQKERLLHDD